MKTNLKTKLEPIFTHEGAKAKRIGAEAELRRSLMACLLWESGFYESGIEITDRIASLVPKVKPEKVALMAIEAREKMKLRHAPLWVVRAMAREEDCRPYVAETLARVIQRADEPAEFLSLYWRGGKEPLSAQVKKGLAASLTQFDEYALAKYSRDTDIKLRDVMFLSHAKPKDTEQEHLWKKLIGGFCDKCWLPLEKNPKHPERKYCKHKTKVEAKLAIPYTWETELSAGGNKKDAWENLLQSKKLGAMALLRNLRNMEKAGVDEDLIFSALDHMKVDRVLPYRFIAAARYAPQWESKLEPAMLKCLEGKSKLSGKTVLLVDVSGSMNSQLSGKSDLTCIDAACGLGILTRELCDSIRIYTFSGDIVKVPDRRGFALRDAINNSQPHGSTRLGAAITYINTHDTYDRLIVITDEQSHDTVGAPKGRGYMINIASNKNGVGYGQWLHLDGFSESVLDYIIEVENEYD